MQHTVLETSLKIELKHLTKKNNAGLDIRLNTHYCLST